MHYVYILQGETFGRIYVGCTADLKRRFGEHQEGKNLSTKYEKKWNLIYYEAYLTLSLARSREKQLKRFAKSYKMLLKRIGL